MKGYVHSIEKAAQQNTTFRTVLYTAKNCQLVVMSLKPSEDIGAEVHKLDQFFRVEEGRCLMALSIASSPGSRSWCPPVLATTSSTARQAR
jgi:mannose-6-phosphate isomerase-like protein (cupin superfamily)